MKNLKTFNEFLLEQSSGNWTYFFDRKPKNFKGSFETPIAKKWFRAESAFSLYANHVGSQGTGVNVVSCTPEFGIKPKSNFPPESQWPGDNPWQFIRVLNGTNKGLCWIDAEGILYSNKPGSYEFVGKKGEICTINTVSINAAPNKLDGAHNSKGQIFDVKAIFNELLNSNDTE